MAPILLAPQLQGPKGPLDVASNKGFGWEVGAVRARLAELIEQYHDVPKPSAIVYKGPGIGEHCAAPMDLALTLGLHSRHRPLTARLRKDPLLLLWQCGGHPGAAPGGLPSAPPCILDLASCALPPITLSRPSTRPPAAEAGRQLKAAWQSLPKLYPPENWRPPPPAGYVDAQVGVGAVAETSGQGCVVPTRGHSAESKKPACTLRVHALLRLACVKQPHPSRAARPSHS